jgi:hypothetical protein
MRLLLACWLISLPVGTFGQTTKPNLLPGDKMERVLKAKGTWNGTGRVLKFTCERSGLNVSVGGAPLPKQASSVGFQVGHRKPAILVAEFVLLADEVNPAIRAALDHELSVTALNTRYLDETPRVFFMNVDAEGDPVLLALAVRKVLDAIEHAEGKIGVGAPATQGVQIDSKKLDGIFASSGELAGGVYRVDLPHEVELPCGCTVGADMGVKSSFVFNGSDDRATLRGELACVAGELQPALKALVAGQIEITGIHNRMEMEVPRTIYVSLRGSGRAGELAKTLKAAWNIQQPGGSK